MHAIDAKVKWLSNLILFRATIVCYKCLSLEPFLIDIYIENSYMMLGKDKCNID